MRNKTNAQLQEIIAAAEAELRRREEEHNRQWINGEITLGEWLWGTAPSEVPVWCACGESYAVTSDNHGPACQVCTDTQARLHSANQ